MMPEYKEDDLKLFAIQLCVKDKFGSGPSKTTQWRTKDQALLFDFLNVFFFKGNLLDEK